MDERPGAASGAAAEHTEPEANVRLSGAKREKQSSADVYRLHWQFTGRYRRDELAESWW